MADVIDVTVSIPIPVKVRAELLEHPTIIEFCNPSSIAEQLRIAIGTFMLSESIETLGMKITKSHLTFFKSKIRHLVLEQHQDLTKPAELITADISMGRHMRRDILIDELGMVPTRSNVMSLVGTLYPDVEKSIKRREVDISIPFLVTEIELISADSITGDIYSTLTISLEDDLPIFRQVG